MTTASPTPKDVLEKVDAFGPPSTPVTTPEIAEEFDCTQRTIYNRLDSLVDDGILQTKKVGANSRVWWHPLDRVIQHSGGVLDRRTPVSLRDGRAPSFLSDSEMAERIRDFEWAETSLGPIDEWPPAFRTAVDIMLGANEAIGIYWGDDLVLLYNDAWQELIGDKHPEALGQPARDVFPEIWGTIGPMLTCVLEGEGAARNSEHLLSLKRNGDLEEAWFDYTFNPIPARVDSIGGVFNVASEVTERKDYEQELEGELAATRELQKISTELIGKDDVEALSERVLDAAVEIVDADFASIQLYDPDRDSLELVSHREFNEEVKAAWEHVTPGHGTTCGMALQTGERVVVPDLETDDDIVATEELENYRQTGIRSMQTTPFISRRGDLLGMFSTHWNAPHEPSEPDLGRLDVLARQAGDLLENRRAAEALRESEAQLDAFITVTSEVVYRMSPDWSEMYYLDGREFIADTDESLDTWLEEYIPSDEQERVTAAITAAIEAKSQFELEHQVLRINGTRGWTHSRAVPMIDNDGEIVEWFGTATDITERKETERKLQQQAELDAFHIDLADAIRSLIDPVEVQREAARVLRERLDVSRANYCEVLSEDGRVIVHSEYLHGDTPSAIGEHRLGDFGQHILESLQAGDSVVVDDLRTDPQFTEEQRTSYSKFGVRSLVAGPILKGGQCTAYVVVNASTPREWTEIEVEMIEETAERTWAAVEWAQAEQALRESREKLEIALEAVQMGTWRWNLDARTVDGDERLLELFDLSNGAGSIPVEEFTARMARGSVGSVEAVTASTFEPGEYIEGEVRLDDVPDAPVWLNWRARASEADPSVLVGVSFDITERKEREKNLRESEASLERLNAVTQELLDAEPETIADRVAPLVREVLDVEYAFLWQYDDQRGELEKYAADASPNVDGALEFPTEISEQVWETFIGSDVDVVNDLNVPTDASSPLRSRAFVPLGRHGVVCLGSTEADTFDEQTVDLVETVASTVETAWNRAKSEAQLEQRNEELTRLNQLNSLVRKIDTSLVEAETVDEIDDAVCERLVASPRYEFAWIGEFDADADAVRPRSWAGVDSSTLQKLTIANDDPAVAPDPFVSAIRTREMQVIEDIVTDARSGSSREVALKHGARSCFSIPLTYDESVYGVLVVYGGSPAQNWDTDVLVEFGQTIAHTINAVETRDSFQADSITELTLRSTTADTPLCRLAHAIDSELEFEGLVPGPGDVTTAFFSVPGAAPERVVAAGEDVLGITEVISLEEHDDDSLFKVRLNEPSIAGLVLEQNATVRSLRIDEGTATIVVDLPGSASVRAFVDDLTPEVPDLELLSRRTRTREPGATLQTAVLERLTPRQQEVLQLAYRSGYFEMPRVQTGKELADALGIAPSTFAKHIRSAERNLLDVLFANGHGAQR
jgi:GAF domain-containing protein/DNA-binding CsgD family transcriptional regulator/DNA-binding Lrp family transcriptional regulator